MSVHRGEPHRLVESKTLRAAVRRLTKLIAADGEVRAAVPSQADFAAIRGADGHSMALIAAACARFSTRTCFVTRGPGGSERRVTYEALFARAVALATALDHERRVRAGDLVCIAGPPSVDWIVADLACSYLGAVPVPLPGGADADDLRHILSETQPTCVFAAESALRSLEAVVDAELGTRVISMDAMGPLEELGASLPPRAISQPAADALFSIVYTSGSTGRPKGVLLPATRWTRTLLDALGGPPIPNITVGYLPLSHMAGRIHVYTTMMTGGVIHLLEQGDMSSLLEDIRAARPTSLLLIPRVSNMIHQQFQAEVLKRGGTQEISDPIAAQVMAEMRATTLGDRLCFATTGAAPTAPEVVSFMEQCFEIQIVDTYGSTEFGRVTVNGRVQPWVQYKLIDVPELGYTKEDLPYPRGELAVKSSRESPGYYKNAEASARLRDEDGFVLSGDIVEEREPGHIVWIDRKHATIRLAQGEFVNVAKLEELFPARSPFIEQIFVHGDSRRAYVVAVVVPNAGALQAQREKTAKIGGDRDARQLLKSELTRIAAETGLAAHEVPRDFIVEPKHFTRDNGLLTETNKPRRVRLREVYGARLDALYAAIELRQLQALTAPEGATEKERIANAVALALGLETSDIDPDRDTFVSLGGDSLSAVRAAGLIAESTGARVQVAALLDRTAMLATVVRAAALSSDRSAFKRIHGSDAEWARAKDLSVERFLPEDLVRSASSLEPTTERRRVLLTGANGYLGRFLLLELLESARAENGEVICLVRAKDDDSARARLEASFKASGGSLADRFAEISRDHLEVRAADLIRPRLGFTETAFTQLAERVDWILHNGALVNHALSYPHLFEPNVVGTAEVARLAITSKRKPIALVSTVGIAAGIKRAGPILESEEASKLWSRRPVRADASDYAVGYSTSKWAAETVLRSVFDQCSVLVSVFRCGMILPHRAHVAAMNEGDAFVRLLFGLVRTGVAPISFYETGGGAAHYDGLPVDFVARAIAAIARQSQKEYSICHVSNSNWEDGISLDEIVAWVESAGVTLARHPYSDWYAELRRRLDALGAEDRARSPLPIINRWERPMSRTGELRCDTSVFRKRLRESFDNDAIPSITADYIRACALALRESR